MNRTSSSRRSIRSRLFTGTALVLALLVSMMIIGSRDGTDSFSVPYGGTNYYSPTPPGCPFYTSWTAECYQASREIISSDMRFLGRNDGSGLHRLWISLDQLFSCFDDTTGFCGYDRRALANVADTLRIMAEYDQKAVLVLFAQSNRPSDVNYFRAEALDGDHPQMRDNYIAAAEEFVRYIAADAVASSAVAVIDLQNEGYFWNKRVLLEMETSCGDSGGCIDRNFSQPFFAELYETLKSAAPQFPYTISAVKGELLGSDMDYWLSMYPVDVYDVHLYVTDPAENTGLFERARDLPKPWFAGEVGTENTDGGACWTYDGNDPCTVETLRWWREHLGPDYGAQAVLVENWGTIFKYTGSGYSGSPAFTRAGQVLTRTP